MENLPKFPRQKQKSKKSSIPRKDSKGLIKLFPWETKYQHTIFDFFQVNENSPDVKKLSSDKHLESDSGDLGKLPKYSSPVKTNKFSYLQESFNFSSDDKLENDDFLENCENLQTQFHCCNDGFGISSKDDCCYSNFNSNSNCLDRFSRLNYSLYDIPCEMKRSYPKVIFEKPSSGRISPFEIGSSLYRVNDLDTLYFFPKKFQLKRQL
ncbi:UNVERIFIED_CONTAM: hypothetical protein RMT77_010710 [Armadillidium vulgare]